MRASKKTEFIQLYKEFAEDYPLTERGQEHVASYASNREQGRQNYQEVEAAAARGEDITQLVILKWMPYADTATNRERGVWVHHAPCVVGDLVKMSENAGNTVDWSATAKTVFQFIKRCNDNPADVSAACQEYAASPHSKGLQTGYLTPILNALRPDDFLLVNSKSQQVLNYFTESDYTAKIIDYPQTNDAGHQFVTSIAAEIRSLWDSELRDDDQFDIFCHWLKSLKKYSLSPTRYWKIAPGANAWQWDDCRNQGFIAIGWDELGDIAKLNRKEFDAMRDQVKEQHPDRKNRGMNQVWKFAQIQEGDRIIANRGQSEVVGIGTVTGPYYYQSDAEQHRHRLPVKWNDTTPRDIKHLGFKWVPTLIGLSAQEFEAIAQAPKLEQESPNQIPPVDDTSTQANPDCPFNLTTFNLLSKLHHTPKKTVYDDHKQDFKSHLEKPFQRLMLDVAAQLPAPIKEVMEMHHRIFGRILKNDFGQGGAYAHYWGAFYPKGSKRTEGAQLILITRYDRLTFGFDIGHYSSQQRERFLANCHRHHESLVELLEPSLDQPHLRFGDRGKISFDSDGIAYDPDQLSFEQWLKNIDSSGVHAFTTLSKANVLSHSRDALRDEICKVFSQLFPLVLLATLDEPMSSLQEYLDSIDPDDDVVVPVNEAYSLAECAAATYLDESLLQAWVHALNRKKQAILYGPPGTGKTFVAQHLTRHLLSGGDGFSALVQFHPAYTYEDFIQGIRPQQGKHGGLDYPLVSGRFLKFCEQARTRQDTCVLIIDEINRANLAQVFGELMYLLEYRDQAVDLAGGKPFSIPENVRIIGTMNTADRSIALVDHALRRRFAFLPLYPDMNILRRYHAQAGVAIESLIRLIEEVNAEINDPQYSIGTSFFLDRDLKTNLEAIWRMEIEPYLQEYFFDQADKVEAFAWVKISDQVWS
jgi:5-methylcytosine-specific restriction protein B